MKYKDFFNLREVVDGQLPQFLYHSTLSAYDDSIREHGIVPGGKECRMYDWCDKSYVYLCEDMNVAESFVSLSNIEIDDDDRYERMLQLFQLGGTTYEIDVSKLDISKLEKDINWNTDDPTARSFAYSGSIPTTSIIKTYKFQPD